MIMLLKYHEKPLKIPFCFQTWDKIVIYVSTVQPSASPRATQKCLMLVQSQCPRVDT